jgi:hypothetical protein
MTSSDVSALILANASLASVCVLAIRYPPLAQSCQALTTPLPCFQGGAFLIAAHTVFSPSEMRLVAVEVAGQVLAAHLANEGIVDRRLPIEAQNRTACGFDLDSVRCDIDDLAIGDEQSGAAKIDAAPQRRNGIELVFGPAETLGFGAMVGGEEGAQAVDRRLPAVAGAATSSNSGL